MEQKPEQKLLLPEGRKSAAGQWAGTIIVVLLIVGVGYFLVHDKAEAPTPEEESATEQNASAVQAEHAFEFSFRIVGGNRQTGADKSEVTLTHEGLVKVVGTYEGHCAVIGGANSPWPLAANEVTGTICSWAHAGDEVGIFFENGAYVVKHGTFKEGTADEPGTRGGYETLFTI